MKRSSFYLALLPFAWLYGLVTGIRNICFNIGILGSKSFPMPILSIGNITVGGTGKTPITEYLIKHLQSNYQLAVLSRGYKRKTKGFLIANHPFDWREIGDEPTQLKHKFPQITVAVDEDRCHGVEELMHEKQNPFIDVILLDDAFQHRKLIPSLSILLIDYNRQIKKDTFLPAGNLRESALQMKRAQIIIVTKCPPDIKPMELRILSTEIGPLPYQSLYFCTQVQGSLKPLLLKSGFRENIFDTPEDSDASPIERMDHALPKTLQQLHHEKRPALIITGIASPEPFIESIRNTVDQVTTLQFNDHHEFTKRDLKKIDQAFQAIQKDGGIIITTEKDAVRLQKNELFSALLPYIYYPTLEIAFLGDNPNAFINKVSEYVRVNKRSRTIPQITN